MANREIEHNGELLSFYDLLRKETIANIVIPIIQRDYAQGRQDSHTILEIRRNMVESFRTALGDSSGITLDCIYGYIDPEHSFIPIDGQQRLTTLFLLHWYVAVAAGKLDQELSALLHKFTYQVRDSAREFCDSLTDQEACSQIDFSQQQPSEVIRNARWYHSGVFQLDPTISGMLTMLDEIHLQFTGADRKTDIKAVFDKLYSEEPPIRFWWLKIDNFGLADDLFIKMNARGKQLTRFEIFKSELESALPDSKVAEEWKENIDNDWLEFFWNYYHEEAPQRAEHGLFRMIVFIGRTINSRQQNVKWEIPMDDIEQIQYTDLLEVFRSDENFNYLCTVLNVLEQFTASPLFALYDSDFRNLLSGEKMDYWEYARLFAVLDYFILYHGNVEDYPAFKRVLNNLLTAQREPNKRDMIFSPQIDARNYGSFTRGITELIGLSLEYEGNVIRALANADTTISGLRGYEDEAAKARYISDYPDQADILYELESLPELNGLIHNIFFDGKLWLTADRVECLLADRQKLLRIIQSYSEEPLLLRVGYLWPLVFGEEEEYSFRRHRYWFNNKNNGDFLLAAGAGETVRWQPPLKMAVKELSTLPFEHPDQEVAGLLDNRIAELTFDSYADYLVKYPEFYTDEEACCYLLPETEGVSEYKLLCCSREWKDYYNPFCYVLAKKLGVSYEPVGIIRDAVKVREDTIFMIDQDGSWLITTSNDNLHSRLSGLPELENGNMLRAEPGKDCIDQAADFIRCYLSE